MKLKHSEIKFHRQTQLVSQNHRCALCDDIITDDAVLDHCHKTGLVRKVLHRGCNALLGKIENNLNRNLISPERLKGIADNLVNYIQTASTDILHPTYKTPEQRLVRARLLAKKRRKHAHS